MLEMIQQKAFQLEPVLGSYGACKFSHAFPMKKPFNYKPLQLPSGHMFMTYVRSKDARNCARILRMITIMM